MDSNLLVEKSKEILIKLWDLIGKSDNDLMDNIMELIHPDFMGFGTTQSEVYTSKSSLKSFLEEQFRQMPQGFTYKIHEFVARPVTKTVIEYFQQMSFEISTPQGTLLIPLRVSGSTLWVKNKVLITQLHGSVPDSTAVDEELFPTASDPKIYEEVSVLFTDFVGFSTIVSTIPPKILVQELGDIFAEFDKISRENGLIKIKTIGDSYMAASGLESHVDHALSAVNCAKKILIFLEKRNQRNPLKWNVRIGIHSGPVVGGVIGLDNLSFDLWGDTVNLASAFEQYSESGNINVSAYTYSLIQGKESCKYRGKIEIKDKRTMDMYYIDLDIKRKLTKDKMN